jgi:ATP-dependent DNA helicase RecG
LTEEQKNQLNMIAAPATTSSRLAPDETRRIILALCQRVFVTAYELGQLMNRNPNSLRNRFLTPLVEEGFLARKYPAEPNRPDQAYTTAASLKTED